MSEAVNCEFLCFFNTMKFGQTTYELVAPEARRPRIGVVSTNNMDAQQELWTYRWRGDPPPEFYKQKVLFRQFRPFDIVSKPMSVLIPAVQELSQSFNLPNKGYKLDWLVLNRVVEKYCLMGIFENRVVAAAAPLSAIRSSFSPARYFSRLHKNPHWKDMYFHCSLRRFTAEFNTGFSFQASRHNLLCNVSYCLHCGVHGEHTLRPILKINDRMLATPYRFVVNESLDNLAGMTQALNQSSARFIQMLGAAYLPAKYDEIECWKLVRSLLSNLHMPDYKVNEFRSDTELSRCRTKLDILLCLSKLFPQDTLTALSEMIKLSKLLTSYQL